MIELRNVDSTAPPAAGAMTAAPGPFLLHAVGLAPSPSEREPLERVLGDVRRASAPADLGRSAVSFAEGRPGDAIPSSPRTGNGWLQSGRNSTPAMSSPRPGSSGIAMGCR